MCVSLWSCWFNKSFGIFLLLSINVLISLRKKSKNGLKYFENYFLSNIATVINLHFLSVILSYLLQVGDDNEEPRARLTRKTGSTKSNAPSPKTPQQEPDMVWLYWLSSNILTLGVRGWGTVVNRSPSEWTLFFCSVNVARLKNFFNNEIKYVSCYCVTSVIFWIESC